LSEHPTEILLVDDDPRNLLAIESALEDVAKIVRARSGEEALRCLLEREFALVLLDVQMPSMDGFETAALIRSRERSRGTPIIFITAFNRDDHEILKAYALGAVDFLFKPVVPEMLRAKASVFVALQEEQARVARQAELLRSHERREHARILADERRRWEEQALRHQMEEERRTSEELTRKTEELTRLIDERERTQGELAHMNERLAQANQRKDQFLAVLAHELRNPLAPLVHGLELFRMRLRDMPSESAEPLRRIQALMSRQTDTLRRLVDDLLDISRIDRGQIELRREEIEIHEVLRQAIATSQPAIEDRRHAVHFEPLVQPAYVDADSVRLVQVFGNVLGNACRYTPEGGQIEVRCATEQDWLSICIMDNGRGIDPELLPRIFDMFVQERRGGEGLGLGLTLARILIEQHGGRIEAHSDGIGRGSRFTIWLPVRHGRQDFLVGADGPVRELRLVPRRVVLVDDHPDVRESLRELLQLWGHTVSEAEDGELGLDTILRIKPDVAFVDIGMPKLDGYGLACRVRELIPSSQIRLVALTGFGQQSDQERAYQAGFDAHLVKPTSPQALEKVFLDLEAAGASR